MTPADLAWRPALELAALIRTKAVSPPAMSRRSPRIEASTASSGAPAASSRTEAASPTAPSPKKQAVTRPARSFWSASAMPAADAREAAAAAEVALMTGEPLGPLHGVPFSVKDLVFTRRVPTTAGSRLFAEHVPEEDAVVVERLKGAGAILVGKTTTPEFGHKALTDAPLFGRTRNAWSAAHTSGGSSGGAAVAVAAEDIQPTPDIASTPEELQRVMQAEMQTWRDVVAKAGLKP